MSIHEIKCWCQANLLSILIILSAILGLIFGFIFRAIFTISPIALTYIALPGILIIRAFMMVIVPLIVSSLATSITGTKKGDNKRLIVTTFSLIILLSTSSAIFGITLMSIVKPGIRDISQDTTDRIIDDNSMGMSFDIKQMVGSQDESIYDVFMNLVPDNVIAATFSTHYTALIPRNAQNLTQGYKKQAERAFKPNMLGLCIFSLILGFAVLQLDSKAQTIKQLLQETQNVIMNILGTLLRIMPVGMFCWMFAEAVKMKSPEKILVQLGWFYSTAFGAFALLWFIVYPAVYFIICRKNPYKFIFNLLPALMVALGSSSSAITLPVTIRCMEDKNNLATIVSQFVLPLGMTINMNGCALYYPMLTMFVAQMHGLSLDFQTLLTLCIFSLIMSMAFPGAPSGGSSIVNFITFCAIIGIDNPMDVLAYTHAIDWIMERMRTMTNVYGDCILAAIVQQLCANQTPASNKQLNTVNTEL